MRRLSVSRAARHGASASISRVQAVAAPVPPPAAAPAAQGVAAHSQGVGVLERLHRRVLRVGHVGLYGGEAGAQGVRAHPAGDGLVVREGFASPRVVAADGQVVHRAAAGCGNSSGQRLGERAEDDVDDALRRLDVARRRRRREAGRSRGCPSGAITSNTLKIPALEGTPGSSKHRKT